MNPGREYRVGATGVRVGTTGWKIFIPVHMKYINGTYIKVIDTQETFFEVKLFSCLSNPKCPYREEERCVLK